MNCRVARRSLVAYLDKDLSPLRVEELETHLARCEGCRAELETLKITLNLLTEESAPVAPEDFLVNLLPRVRIRLEERQRARTQLLPRFAYVSAAVLVVLVALLLLRPSRGPETGTIPVVQNGSEWVTLVQELVTTVDVEAVELSLLEYESPSVVLSLPEFSEGVSELLTKGVPSADLERVSQSLEEEGDVSISAWVEDLSESEKEELAATIKARWGRE